MGNLTLDKTKPGDVLAAPVRNHQGLMLLKAGTRISADNLRMLKSWGVTQVSVEGGGKGEIAPEGETARAQVTADENRIREKFSQAGENPVMERIMEVAIRRLKRKTSKDGEEKGTH